jgi:molecular chaperone GrpE (heat shock protein)
MTRYFLHTKQLTDRWVAIPGDSPGGTVYFDMDNGQQQDEHPNMRVVREMRQNQRIAGERKLHERLQNLQTYREQLQAGEDRTRRALEQRREEIYQNVLRKFVTN